MCLSISGLFLLTAKEKAFVYQCVFGKGGCKVEGGEIEWAAQTISFLFCGHWSGGWACHHQTEPFPTIKPSKNIPFVSVTAPTHRSHSAMSVDYVALKFTSATDNIISLIMSYGLLPPSDVRSSAHGPFTYSRFSQSLLVRLTGGVLSTFG